MRCRSNEHVRLRPYWIWLADRSSATRELPNLVILANRRRRKETRGFQAGRSSFDPTLGTGLCFFYLGWFASTLRVLQILEETGCCHRVGCVWGKPSKDLFLRESLKLNILRDFCENLNRADLIFIQWLRSFDNTMAAGRTLKMLLVLPLVCSSHVLTWPTLKICFFYVPCRCLTKWS